MLYNANEFTNINIIILFSFLEIALDISIYTIFSFYSNLLAFNMLFLCFFIVFYI